MFFIHSAASHKVHRNVLRHFVGNAALSTAHDWTTVFFVGISKNQTEGRVVLEEAAKYGDMVVLPYEDTYQNLTYKFVYGMKWTLEFCPSVKYIVKIDDDMVANLVRVVRYLRRLRESPGFELHCYVWSRATVFRETNSPWYIPPDVYPRNKFPDYCSGRGVLFKSGALRRLYSASFCLPFHGIDDVYVTGDAALWANVGHVAINSEVSQDGENWEGVANGRVIFSHIHNHTLRSKAWDLIVRELQRQN
uniref:Hexosyltransferase n=1 Tax=Ixodes ricinus TaxID=34613 RepID=V5H1X0_IXORI